MEIKNKNSYHDKLYNLDQIKSIITTNALTRPNQFNEKYLKAPDFDVKEYTDYWKLNWDEFIVASDAHSPFTREETFNLMIKVALKYKIKKFIHAGDFWNQDQFSNWWVAKEDLIDFNKEVKRCEEIIRVLLGTFDEVRFFMGSHDLRFWRMQYDMGKASEFDDIWGLIDTNLFKRIKLSKYRFCEVGDFRITHPKNVLRIGGYPAIKLFAKHGKSIIFGHGHWWGHTFAPDGIHHIIAPGCLVDKNQIAYKSVWDTSHDEWVPGFCVILEKNKPQLFSESTPLGLYFK